MGCHLQVKEIPIGSPLEGLTRFTGGRRQAWTVAGTVGGIAVVALLLAARGAPARIAPPAVPVSSVPSPAHEQEPSSGNVAYVHVAGAVRHPGLFTVPVGARVADALEAAGGATRKAELEALNLAQLVMDGMKIQVPLRGANPIAGDGAEAGTTSTTAGGPVSLNSSDQVALEAIAGIGPVKAAAIIRFREENGPFTSLEQVMEVSGVGPATFETIRPFISL